MSNLVSTLYQHSIYYSPELLHTTILLPTHPSNWDLMCEHCNRRPWTSRPPAPPPPVLGLEVCTSTHVYGVLGLVPRASSMPGQHSTISEQQPSPTPQFLKIQRSQGTGREGKAFKTEMIKMNILALVSRRKPAGTVCAHAESVPSW